MQWQPGKKHPRQLQAVRESFLEEGAYEQRLRRLIELVLQTRRERLLQAGEMAWARSEGWGSEVGVLGTTHSSIFLECPVKRHVRR